MKISPFRLISWLGLVPLTIGVGIGIVTVLLAGFIYLRGGFLDPRADIPINPYEKAIAVPSLNASVARRAPNVHDPVASTESNLAAGMKVFQSNCAGCHGDILHPVGQMAHVFYPRAPQFMKHAPAKPANQLYFIIHNGIRMSGMPAWNSTLNDKQTWQVATFLSKINQLPTAVSDQWKAAASSPSGGQ